MRKWKYLCVFVMTLSIIMLVGCGKSTEKSPADNDNCVVVEVPEGSEVKSIFHFESTSQTSLTGGSGVGVADGVYRMGKLEDGNSIVWRSEDVFLYVPGEAEAKEILHYGTRLKDTPISYDEFKEKYVEE